MAQKCIYRYEPTDQVKYFNAHQRRVSEDLGYSHIHEPHVKEELAFCRACTLPLQRGQWVFSKPSSSGNVKRYHLKCAVRLLIVDEDMRKYRDRTIAAGIYVAAMITWAGEIGRYLLIS